MEVKQEESVVCDGISVESPPIFIKTYEIHKMLSASRLKKQNKQRGLGVLHISNKGRK